MRKVSAFAIAIAFTISLMPSAAAADKNPYGTSIVDPAGPNEVILSIIKGSRKATFTDAKLSKMKKSIISIYEPFLKKRQTFTVIPMKNFFALAGISGNDKVITTALNDYTYTNTAARFIAANAYVAIKRNGQPIPYDQGGPLRLVFDDQSKWAKQLDAWNWSLSSISVK